MSRWEESVEGVPKVKCYGVCSTRDGFTVEVNKRQTGVQTVLPQQSILPSNSTEEKSSIKYTVFVCDTGLV